MRWNIETGFDTKKELSRTGARLFRILYERWSVDITGTANGFDPLVGHYWKLFPQVVDVYVDTAVKRGQRPTQRPLGESLSADNTARVTQQTFQHVEFDSCYFDRSFGTDDPSSAGRERYVSNFDFFSFPRYIPAASHIPISP